MKITSTEIEEYFSDILGNSYQFKMLYSNIFITGINHYTERILDLNNGGVFKERNVSKKLNQVCDLHIPVLISKNEISSVSNHIYGTKKDVTLVTKSLDLGNINDSNRDEILSIGNMLQILESDISESLPDNYIFLNNQMLNQFAISKGYDFLSIKAYDNSNAKPPIAYCGPEWTFNYNLGMKKVNISNSEKGRKL